MSSAIPCRRTAPRSSHLPQQQQPYLLSPSTCSAAEKRDQPGRMVESPRAELWLNHWATFRPSFLCPAPAFHPRGRLSSSAQETGAMSGPLDRRPPAHTNPREPTASMAGRPALASDRSLPGSAPFPAQDQPEKPNLPPVNRVAPPQQDPVACSAADRVGPGPSAG